MLGEIPFLKLLRVDLNRVGAIVEAFSGRHRFDITFKDPGTNETRLISLKTTTRRADVTYNTNNSLRPLRIVADEALYQVLTSLVQNTLPDNFTFYSADFEVINMSTGFKKPEVMVHVTLLHPPSLSQPIGSPSQNRNGNPNVHPQAVFVSGYSLYLKQEQLRNAGISIRYL